MIFLANLFLHDAYIRLSLSLRESTLKNLLAKSLFGERVLEYHDQFSTKLGPHYSVDHLSC